MRDPAFMITLLWVISGATARMSGATAGLESAWTSSIVRVVRAPRPWLIPLTTTVPGVTVMRLVPSRVMPLPMVVLVPVPMPTVTISAPTPIRIPREVSSDRIRLPRTARSPLTIVCSRLIRPLHAGHPPS